MNTYTRKRTYNFKNKHQQTNTVYKHLKEYRENPFNKIFQDQFNFMYPKVLSTVFNHAVNGDTKTVKLYFEFSGINKIGHSGTDMTNNYTLDRVRIIIYKLTEWF